MNEAATPIEDGNTKQAINDLVREHNINAPVELNRNEDNSPWKLIEYKCNSCKAVDHDKLYGSEASALAINCWNCGAGKNMELQQMLVSKKGMFPTGEPVPYN